MASELLEKLDLLDKVAREQLVLQGISILERNVLEELRIDIAKAINGLLHAQGK